MILRLRGRFFLSWVCDDGCGFDVQSCTVVFTFYRGILFVMLALWRIYGQKATIEMEMGGMDFRTMSYCSVYLHIFFASIAFERMQITLEGREWFAF